MPKYSFGGRRGMNTGAQAQPDPTVPAAETNTFKSFLQTRSKIRLVHPEISLLTPSPEPHEAC